MWVSTSPSASASDLVGRRAHRLRRRHRGGRRRAAASPAVSTAAARASVDRGGQDIGRGLGHPAIVPDASTSPGGPPARVRCGTMGSCPPPAVRPVRGRRLRGRPGRTAPDRMDTTPLDVRAGPATRADARLGRRPARSPDRPAGGRRRQKLTVTRVAAARSQELTAAAARRVRAASRADGAGESGLTQLLWVNALHMAGDAMIAVSLAGTLFFAATDRRPARQRRALPAGHDGPVRRPRPGHRAGAGPAAARPALGDRRAATSGGRCSRW